MDALERKVSTAVARHHMLPAGKLAVVAVSGGADSICLMQMLHRLDCRLMVAHLNHGLRGECAERDAAFVQGQAEQLGLPCIIGQRDVPALQRAEHLSPEEAAREARYEFLNEVAAKHQAAAIFLAHTADDQAETFLLRLIRGAGVAGLAAMRPKRGLLCRPMLGIWRWEVENYLRQAGHRLARGCQQPRPEIPTQPGAA